MIHADPMLVSEYPCHSQRVARESEIFIQPKLNGWRCIADMSTGELYSRSGQVFALPHISDDFRSMRRSGFIDGELYCHGFTLGEIQTMIKKSDPRIKFHAFDILSPGDFAARSAALNQVRGTKNIEIVQTFKIESREIDAYYNLFLAAKFEGAIVRMSGGRYESGRSADVLKIKPVYD